MSLCFSAGRLGLECEDDFSSPMQVKNVSLVLLFLSALKFVKSVKEGCRDLKMSVQKEKDF